MHRASSFAVADASEARISGEVADEGGGIDVSVDGEKDEQVACNEGGAKGSVRDLTEDDLVAVRLNGLWLVETR